MELIQMVGVAEHPPTGSTLRHLPEAVELAIKERQRQVALHKTGRFDNLIDEARGALESKAPHPMALTIFGEEVGEYCRAVMEGDLAHAAVEMTQVAACALAIVEGLLALQHEYERALD